MICSICHQDFDTSGCDDKGFKETKIQQNSSDGKYYCMKCAMKKYNDELKITVKERRRNINMREIGSSECMYTISKAAYFQAQCAIQDIIKDYKKSWMDGKDTIIMDGLYMKLNRLSNHLAQSVESKLSLEELDSVIDKLGEPEFIPEYLTGKNKCDI